ncbi:MAG TPA: ABC transporter substrate-binding protein/permease [Terrimicrobiaceae bacterium]|nr:ABC transporter substrate-binding protein/permease [Terrimicrobiaceae bacterium]
MKRLVFLVLLALAGILRADEPVLRWGAAPDSNAPYAFYGPGNRLSGFEYEIINAVARHMGRKAVFVQNDWDGLIPGLGRGLYDCVICGIEITPEKAQKVTFSDPYYVTYEQFVIRRGAPPVTNLSQLSGKAIGTLSQTSAYNMLMQTPGVQVKTYDEEVNAYQDVVNGRLFGVLLDYPIAKYYAAPDPNLQFTGPPFGQVAYGIAVKKGNTVLVDQINAALAEMVASGELRDILSRWGLWTQMAANTFGQPEEPSLPDTEYRAFVAATTAQPTLWNRLIGYGRFAPLLFRAAVLTVEVSLVGMVFAVLLGFTLAIFRVFGPWPLRWLATLYIELIRGTPLLIQLLIIFYGLPNIGIKLTPFVAGVLGLALNYAAYEAENYRAGLLAIPKGQMEAARALGMTRRQGLFHVVIPQSFRLVLPPVTNDFISLLKDSSLVSMVTLVDLSGAYKQIATQTFDYFGTGLLVAVIYLLIGLPFVRLARFTEERLAVDQRRPGQKPGLFSLPRPKRKS